MRSKIRQSKPATTTEKIQKLENQALLRLVSELEVHRYDTDAAPFIMTELVYQYEKHLLNSSRRFCGSNQTLDAFEKQATRSNSGPAIF